MLAILAEAMRANLVNLRRSIHRRPEIGLDLPTTQRLVLQALEGLPLEITLGRELSSVTAVLRGGRPDAGDTSRLRSLSFQPHKKPQDLVAEATTILTDAYG